MEACVIGETIDGTPCKGCDSVRTVPDMVYEDEWQVVATPHKWVRRPW